MSRTMTVAATACTALAICAITAPADAQINIAVNTVTDRPDFDLTDGICDCDQPLPGAQCSLRAALQNANQLGGWVIVTLAAQPYLLTFGGTDDSGASGDLDIFSGILTRLEIAGAGPITIIDAAGLMIGGSPTPDRVFHITSGVAGTCEIEIRNLAITGGGGVQLGAGIRHDAGRLTLAAVNVFNCTANDSGGGVHTSSPARFAMNQGSVASCTSAFNGGGIMVANPGTATVDINTVSISDNNAMQGRGGGVRTAAGSASTITGCTISLNEAASGAGISNRGTLVVRDTTIDGNSAIGTGGGAANDIGGSLALERCIVLFNDAPIGGGLNISADATVVDTSITGNLADTGAGISNSARLLRLRRCTINGNLATGPIGGGGYRGFGGLDMLNSTFNGNSAALGQGGNLYLDGGLFNGEISACTIASGLADIAGAGIYTDNTLGASVYTFIGTIVADNFLNSGIDANFAGTIPLSTAGANLDTDGLCNFNSASDQSNVPALLGPLQNNGGFTHTRALNPGSRAINHGSCFTVNGNPITEDQRGVTRVSPCDTGAYEFQLPPPPNDVCALAANVGPGSFLFTNVGANTDGPPQPCGGFTGLPGQDSDVWFRYTATCAGISTITIAPVPVPPSIPNRLLAVYPICPTGGGPPPIVCGSAPGPVSGTVQHQLGQTFIIRMGMPGGNQGDSTLDITVTCACAQDIDGDFDVDTDDLVAVILNWGPCPSPCPPRCAQDIAPLGPPQGNCAVDSDDLVAVILAWGPCP